MFRATLRVQSAFYASLILALILLAPHAIAQQNAVERFLARTWTETEGLPNNSVTAVLQTHDGYLWVGTQNGLATFDGVSFKKIPFPNSTNAQPWITDICEDSKHRVWIGTDHGELFCYPLDTSSRTMALVKSLAPITSLATEASGALWIGTRKGLFLLQEDGANQMAAREWLPGENVSSVCVARSGKVWITTRLGVYLLENGNIEKYRFTPENQGRSPEYLGVYEDQQHELWAFGDTYLIKLAEGKRFNYFRSGQVPSMRIWSFHEGADGRLWVGTSGRGLFQFTGEGFRPVEIPNNNAGPNDVRSICEDREGNMWLGTDGGGLIQLRQEHVRKFGAFDGLPGDSAICMVEDGAKNLVVAFPDGGFFSGNSEHFEPYKPLNAVETPPFIRAISASKNGDFWVASFGMGLTCYRQHRRVQFDTASGLFENFVTDVCAATNGDVWVGTRSGRLYRLLDEKLELKGQLDGPIGAILPIGPDEAWIGADTGAVWRLQGERLTPVVAGTNSPDAAISSICQDSRGRVWAGTRRQGLRYCSGSDSTIWPFADSGGALSIYGLTMDAAQNLWMTTSRGIAMIDHAELSHVPAAPTLRWIEHFDGVEPAHLAGPCALRGSDGFLWFILAGEVIRVDPRNWKPQRMPPPVYIESVRINDGKSQFPGALLPAKAEAKTPPVRMPPGLHAVEFEFTTPTFTLPERVLLRHKLEGLDADWIVSKPGERRASYGSLPPGDYSFQVTACTADGTWNLEGASFPFYVPAPLWRSPWAVSAYVLALAAAVYLTARMVSHRRFRLQVRKLEQNAAMFHERIRIAQDMHDEIGSKLAKISFLSEGVKTELEGVYNNAEVVDSLSKTSRDLLQSLDQMVWAVNPRNDTAENVAAYFCSYATDYFQNTPIVCEFSIAEEFPLISLSAETRHNAFLAFEEVLTNAMKHSGASKIKIAFSLEKHALVITIEDNGCGFDAAAKYPLGQNGHSRARHGLSGIHQRFQSIAGECSLETHAGHGARWIFKIPVKSTN